MTIRARGQVSMERGPLFARRLAAAIEARGVTLVWLRERLADSGNPVSLTTLSYWRSGRRHPEGAASIAAVEELERLLVLDPSDLTRYVVSLGGGATQEQAVVETRQRLGAGPMEAVRDVNTQIVVEVDEHGHQRTRSVRSLIQVLTGSLQDLTFFEVLDAPSEKPPTFRAVSGCEVRRVYNHPGRRVFGALLGFEAPVDAPDTVLFEFCMDLPFGYPDERFIGHTVGRSSREAMIWVKFHPDRRPVYWEAYSSYDGAEREITRHHGPVPSIHSVRRNFGPGQFGVRWSFEEDADHVEELQR